MLGALWHRGPDGYGQISCGDATLGATRLAIVDPAAGAQPMAGAGRFVVYNGEIYNHAALRAELEALGHVFRTRSDTEIVPAAHAQWGPNAALRFDGMFAYAIHDPATGELLLVRDRFGIKPLYWQSMPDGGLAFASEPKALLALDGGRGRPDYLGLASIFAHGAAFPAGCEAGERTCFEGVQAVPAATVVRFRNGTMVSHRYWSFADARRTPFTNPGEAREALEAAFVSSVRACRQGDAQIGACLSGGLDSSLITAELVGQGQTSLAAATITYRSDFNDPDAAAAKVVATHLGDAVDHRFTWLPLETYTHDIDTLVRAFDEPCWEPRKLGMLNNYRTLRAAGCKIALTGEGADELFFGYYPRFEGWRPPAMKSSADFAALWRSKLGPTRTLLAPAFAAGLVQEQALYAVVDDAVARWLAPAWKDPEDRVFAVQGWYAQTFLHWLLADNDRFGIAFSVEGRFPFLTNEMVDVALRIPLEWSLPGAGGLSDKAALRALGAAAIRLERARPLCYVNGQGLCDFGSFLEEA
jgi:asparagine synthase (glutamine-hydrolysing)